MSELVTTESGPVWRRDWSSFGPPQMVAFGLLVVAVVILGFWFMQWSTTPTWEVVVTGLAPADATDARAELETASIPNRLANGGSSIEVQTDQSAEARVALGDAGVISGGIEGYEILDSQGFTTSSFRQRIDYQRAIEGELAKTIMSVDSITMATVHLAVPEERLFSDTDELKRASVVVTGDLDGGTVDWVVNIVSSAVPGLEPESVTVANTSGRILSGPQDSTFGQDRQLQMQELYESQLALDAETMLTAALGPGSAVVRVAAELDFDETESETVTYTPDEEVTLRTETVDEAFIGDRDTPIGTLGVTQDVTDAGELAGADGSAYLRKENSSEFGVPSTRTVSRQAPGTVKRLTVAVLLDENLDPAPDTAALQPLVAAAVGIDETRGDEIVVQAMTFDQPTPEELEALGAIGSPIVASGGLTDIINYVKTAVAVVGLLLALLFLRKGLKTLTADPTDKKKGKTKDLAALDAGTGSEGDAEGEAGLQGAGPAAVTAGQTAVQPVITLDSDGSSTVNMLQLIDQQPDEVADLLRGWMSEAGV